MPQSDDIVRKDQQLRDLQRDNEKLKARLKLLELKNVEHEKKTKLRQPQPKTQATETDLKDCVDKDLNVQQQDQLKQQQQQQTPPAADFATKQEAAASSAKRLKRRTATAASSTAPKSKSAKSEEDEDVKPPKAPEFVCAAKPFFVLEGEDFVKQGCNSVYILGRPQTSP